MTAKDVEGWDSFKQIEIIMASEEQWHPVLHAGTGQFAVSATWSG